MKTLFVLAAFTLILVIVITHAVTIQPVGASLPSHEPGVENYDIRTDTSAASREMLTRLRGNSETGFPPMRQTDQRFSVELNAQLGIVEIVAPGDADDDVLAVTGARTRAQTLIEFVTSNRSLFGVGSTTQLRKVADYQNPDGNLSYALLGQELNGIPVFGAEVKAGFSRNGEMFRVINSLAPHLDSNTMADVGAPEHAIVNAAAHIGMVLMTGDLIAEAISKPHQARFSSRVSTDTILAEKFYFPVGSGVARPAWRVFLETDKLAYYVVVDIDGTLLWRKNLIEHQANSATYNVYGNTTSLLKTADSPSPFTPGCLAPTGCPQPPAVARTNFTLIGNEVPYTFNNTGWIPDAGLPVRTPANPNITDGNNVEAGIDRVAPNGIDENGWAVGNPARVFNYAYNPAPGIPPPGEEPLPPAPQPTPPTAFQQGVITHGFYTLNRWHDEMYRFGFNEQAGNFQHSNFGRGGSEGDRVAYEIQDSSGTNSGSVSVTADGNRPRLVMMIFTNPTPDRDGALDGHIVLHEITHALTGRLHGNTTGLGSNMSRGMGEGWSDFYPLALLSQPVDDRFGTHALTGYVFYLISPGYESNYYYGIRRFPVAIFASRGTNGLPHNPLTFGYINSNCNVLIGTTTTNPNSAFPRGPIGVNTCDQVHNIGEMWAVTLWEVRDQLIQRHGAAEGNRRVLQYVTDGMKLSPLNPTIINSRDAILAAASISDPGDVGPVWRGFAIRGLGFGASIQNPGTGNNNTVVTESFNIPVQFRRPPRADFDGDGLSDVSVFRPSDRIWYLNRSSAGFTAINWGLSTDELVPEDYDGDGKTDVAVFRAASDGATPDYYIVRSADSTIQYVSWGNTGDIPVSEDFDGDGKADPAIYRPSTETGQFWVRRSGDGSILKSTPIVAGVPMAGDFDGDGRGDVATYADGVWRLLRSETAYTNEPWIYWGAAGDKVVHADYDGDGKDDLAVYRPSDGTWYITHSAGGNRVQRFGISTDIPAPADYDGDGRADIAVYRNGTWYIDRSTSGILITGFGLAGDQPLAAAYLP